MKRLALGLVLVLAVSLRLLPTASWAGSMLGIAVVGGKLTVVASGAAVGPAASGALILSASRRMADFEAGAPSGPTYLIVDATPPEAQVFLDGRLLGTAQQLVARAFPLPPGRHAVEIVAPGFRPYIAQFISAAGSFPIRIRLALVPE
ncbi:MAG: PEGA domain-containing protein [Candidatus Rokubacteria bacterium]|nr:PEGA domain-containing protein [Candidatus Rokubacteria bacterium]